MDNKTQKKFDKLSHAEKLKAASAAREFKDQSEMWASKLMHQLYIITCNNDPNLKTMLGNFEKYNKIGFMAGSIPECEDMPIFQLALVPKDYSINIYSPDQYTETIYKSLAYMLRCATFYHVSILQSNPRLINYMRKIRPDVDFSKLQMNEKDRSSLFFDPQCEQRIGVFCLWVDKDNKLIRMDGDNTIQYISEDAQRDIENTIEKEKDRIGR